MAKLSSNDAQFIRNVFKRERQSAELAISNKDLARNSVGGGVFGSAIDSSVNGVMGDILSLDRRMLYRYRDYEEMDEYGDISCLSGDSLVFTLEWGWRRIDNLAEHGGQFYVLSYDKGRRSIVPAKCDGARMTGQRGHVKRMVRVVLDNGTSIRCTADHLFMLKNEGWTRAEELEFGSRLMPGETRIRKVSDSVGGQYWQVHQPHHDSEIKDRETKAYGERWIWVHRLVGNDFLGRASGDIVHHVDENTCNNSPDNLELLSRSEHAKKHISKGNTLSLETRRKMSIAGRGKRKSPEWRRRIGEAQPHRKDIPVDVLEATFINEKTVAGAARSLGVSWSTAKRHLEKNDLLSELGNHRVVAVEQLDITEDVYDLSVPKYRNFVCNGVVVHNSALDIYSDDATQVDGVTGKSVWVETDDGKVKDELTDLFDKRLRIEEKIWEITRTLCKYGNDLEEIVVGDNGVVGLNYLAVPTMRRVENKRGDLIGFMQTYSRDTDISPEEFEKMRISTGGALGPQKDIAVFEDWRVAHMRLTSKYRDSLYGWAVTDAARWIWKRLMLLEDAVLVYKLCLRGDSEIWTESGYKKIADIEEGDVVYCYGRDDKLRKTEVVYKKYNGRDRIFKVSSRSRDLYANATHPVLVETILKNVRGKKRGRLVGYVEVKDIKPGEHRFMTPSISGDGEEIELKFPETIRVAKARRPITMVVGIRQLQNNCGVQSNIIKSFFSGERVINHDAAIRLLDENGTLDAELDVWEDWGGYRRCGIPPVVTEDFARLWGFMIGDGYVSKRLFKKNGREYFVREVGFAAGDKAEVNNEYKELFEEFFGKAAFVGDKRSKHDCVGNMSVSSKPAYEFMIMNGFIPGAHNKRLPEWVFRASGSVKHAFLQGLLDADGWTEDGGVSEERSRVRHGRMNIELCNEGLVHDVRNLVMQLGFRVSRVSVREREGGRAILDNGSPLLDRASYCLSWSFDRQPISEEIKSVDLVGEDDIWDIGVKAEEHNFVADGVVVHNTRSPSRYAFYVDIGKLGKAEGERALQETMQRLKKRKFVNPRTGKLDLRFSPLSMDEDFFLAMREGRESTRVESLMGPSYQQVDDVQYFLYKLYAALKVPRAYMGYDENQPSKATLCLAGDTRVPLLDGTEPMISELSERDDSFWVYSVDDKNNIVPGLARNARLTKRQAETVEVELDSGEVLTCTSDHPIMMRDGHYEEAGDLKTGDSVMPLYRRVSVGNMSGYEEVYDPGDDSWRFTHRMVTDSLFDDVENGFVRHHVNFYKGDNRPENLKIMGIHEHMRLHARHAEKTLMRPDVVDKKIKAQKEWLKTDEGKAVIQKNLLNRGGGSKFQEVMRSDAYRKKHSDLMRARHSDPSDGINKYRSSDRYMDVCNEHSLRMTGEGNPRFISGTSFEELVDVARSYRCKSLVELSKWTGWGISVIYRVLSDVGVKYKDFADKYMASSKFRDSANRRWRNHKVVSVRSGPVVDTYDLTVDGYHNFAVGQGIVVHNSQEDVRFARTILRVQREVRNGLRKVAKVDLAARKIDPDAVDFDVKMTVPSSIFELGQMEVRRARADLASMMERHVSQYWLLKNIYGMSEDDIQELTKQKKDENKMANEMGGTGGGRYEDVIVPTGGRRGFVGYGRPGMISERELFDGNREHERQVEERIRKAINDPNSHIGKQLRETGHLLREILFTVRRVA